MKKLFYLKLIYITIMFFFIFTVVLAQSELKMEDPLYQQYDKGTFTLSYFH